jgi:hypothetical protein
MNHITTNSICSFKDIIKVSHQAPRPLLASMYAVQFIPQPAPLFKLIQGIDGGEPTQKSPVDII